MRLIYRACSLAALAALFVFVGADRCFADFVLGDAANYAILFEGGGMNTLQITNVTTNTAGGGTGVAAGQGGGVGNIGVGGMGMVTVSGPSTVNGSFDFLSAQGAYHNQFSSNNGSNTFQGPNYGISAVSSALSTVNALNTTLGNLSGTDITISNAMNPSNASIVNVNGGANMTTLNANQGKFSAAGTGYTNVEVFNVTSFSSNSGDVLTISGDNSGDSVVLNFNGLSANFDASVVLQGGLTPDEVLFNFVGGSDLSGGPTLSINNGGGSPSNGSNLTQGIFLDPNGPISVVNSNVTGRIFGGDSHDFQYVSGSNVTGSQQAEVPEPSEFVALSAMSIVCVGGFFWRRGRVEPA